MKRLLTIGSFLLCGILVVGQPTTQVTTTKGTIVNTSPNRVSVYAKPATPLTNRIFENLYVTVSIPDQGGGNPAITVDSNFLPTIDWTAEPIVIYNGRAYYTFAGFYNNGTTTVNWNTGNNKVITLIFSNPNGFGGAQLNDESDGYASGGGPNGLMFWYIQINNDGGGGVTGDITDYTAKFYGTNPIANNGGVGNPSFVGSQPISILPVIFKDFNVAKQGNNDALLTWTTSMEQNTSHFVVERSLNQGQGWTKFAEVKAKGNSNTPTRYTQSDVNVYDGREANKLVFYRVRSVDVDSRETMFPVRSIRFSAIGSKQITIYPNPAKDGFYLSVPLINPQDDRPMKLNLVNRLGQLVHTREISSVLANNYYYDIKTPGVISGEYMLQIIYNGELLETKKVIVQR